MGGGRALAQLPLGILQRGLKRRTPPDGDSALSLAALLSPLVIQSFLRTSSQVML